MAILELIYAFYEQGNKNKEPSSYLFFSDDEKSNIMINNASQLESKNDIYIIIYLINNTLKILIIFLFLKLS